MSGDRLQRGRAVQSIKETALEVFGSPDRDNCSSRQSARAPTEADGSLCDGCYTPPQGRGRTPQWRQKNLLESYVVQGPPAWNFLIEPDRQEVAMGTAAMKHPFSDLSDTDLAEYERRVRAMRTLADVMREVESFTRTEHELSGPSSRPEGSSGSAPPRVAV